MKGLRLLLGALGMGLLWAAMWAAAGALIQIADSNRSLDEIWLGPAIGIHPGFVGGIAFFAMLAIGTRPRRFTELPLATVIGCGAIVGLVLGMLPLAINKPPDESPLWLVAAVVIGSMMLMSAISAVGSLMLAKTAGAKRR